MRRNLEDLIDLGQQRATELVGWCCRVALHQEFGVGAKRWDRLESRMIEVSERCLEVCMEGEADGKCAGQRSRETRLNWLPEGCPEELRIPLRRAPRGRKEQHIKIAEDRAATTTWQMLAIACAWELGFAAERLQRLYAATLENIRQLDEWAREDGPEVALERLRRCAEDACAQAVSVDNRNDDEVLAENRSSWQEQMDRYQKRAILREVARRTAKEKPAPGPELSADLAEKFAECRSLAEGQAYWRRRI